MAAIANVGSHLGAVQYSCNSVVVLTVVVDLKRHFVAVAAEIQFYFVIFES